MHRFPCSSLPIFTSIPPSRLSDDLSDLDVLEKLPQLGAGFDVALLGGFGILVHPLLDLGVAIIRSARRAQVLLQLRHFIFQLVDVGVVLSDLDS